jgi:uncharacterized membrane protein YfcA
MKLLNEYLANTTSALFIACFLFIGLALIAAMGPVWLFWALVMVTFGLAMLVVGIWAIVSIVESASHWVHDHHWFDSGHSAH